MRQTHETPRIGSEAGLTLSGRVGQASWEDGEVEVDDAGRFLVSAEGHWVDDTEGRTSSANGLMGRGGIGA
jgi:hypothetical protein